MVHARNGAAAEFEELAAETEGNGLVVLETCAVLFDIATVSVAVTSGGEIDVSAEVDTKEGKGLLEETPATLLPVEDS